MIETIRQFFDACHPFGYPLLACSVILISAIVYHLLFSSRTALLRRLEGIPDREQLRQTCEALPGDALAWTVLLALTEGAPAEKRIEARLARQMDADRTGMATISVITNIAPMLGILGTAWGLVDIFGVFGTPGAEEGIAVGISKALYTTIFGLAIAVPGIIALTCFERRLERKAARLTTFFSDLLATPSRKN